MKDRDRFVRLCLKGMQIRGVGGDERFKERLKKEIKEIDAQGEHEYFLGIYDKFKAKNLKFPENQYNNLVDYLLELTDKFNIDKPSTYIQGEFPDIDIDYIEEPRDYIKRVWAPKVFGQETICEIGTYGTSGIKSSILDMTRVHNQSKDEIQSITTKMADKDDEGHDLEWDKALEIYPDFKAYCDNNAEVAHAAQMLLDRIRSGGVHPSGLIIADRRLDGLVPLEVRKVDKDNPDGVICSAWTEGLNRQDLQPVGLIKFDLLVLNNLIQIAEACKLVKERHGIESICALPGQWDWSDISYLNDPLSLAMADKGDLRCIFQFDSEGIRKMVKMGGVSKFDDIAAYSALYRPGPLNVGMDVHYRRRKRGEEPYNIHPVMQKSLGKTYGVMVFQEQIMDILRFVGLIPDMHTEKVRKAISKKRVKEFIKYKEQFIDNGQKVLDVNSDYVINLWEQIESFAEYGFNASHSYAYAYISARLLWLKTHYPIEFYTAILKWAKGTDKFKDYKLDAQKHGVEIKPVHINKSKQTFDIHDGKIFFGFSNIKGIGKDVADRIVESQSYKDISDFLHKFGTDMTTLKPLVALGIFDEKYDRITLRKFAEWYKKQVTARKDRKKRFEQSMDKKLQELKLMLLEEAKETDPDFEKLCDFTEDAEALWGQRFAGITRQVPYKYKGEERIREVTFVKQLQDLMKSRASSIAKFYEKEKDDDESPITIDQFNPALIKLDEEEEKLLKDEIIVDGNKSFPSAESNYYGFQWTHILETSPDYSGATIDKFLEETEKGLVVGNIEVQIIAVKKRTSKKGTIFYSVEVEDSNGKRMSVNVWSDDYERFKDDLKGGNLVSMQVNPPGGGFNTLTFKSWPRQDRKKMPLREDDPRLIVMKLPPKPEPIKEESLDELIFDASAVEIIETPEPPKPEVNHEVKTDHQKPVFLSGEPFFG